jgi:hypothetical protein
LKSYQLQKDARQWLKDNAELKDLEDPDPEAAELAELTPILKKKDSIDGHSKGVLKKSTEAKEDEQDTPLNKVEKSKEAENYRFIFIQLYYSVFLNSLKLSKRFRINKK